MFGFSRPRELDEDDASVRWDQTPRSTPAATPRASPRASRNSSRGRSGSPGGDVVRDISQHGDVWDAGPGARRGSPTRHRPPSPSPETPMRTPGSAGSATVYGNRSGSPSDRPVAGAVTPLGGLQSRVSSRGPSTPDPRNIGPGGIYHEKLVGRVSALHCVNNVLQEPIVTEEHLSQTAQHLDRAEQRLAGGRARDYGNMRKDGYYNLQVVQAVFSSLGYEVCALRGRITVDGESAFILNKCRHWWAVRRLGTGWFDLNCCLPKPEHYDSHDIQEHFDDAQAQGYYIYVVRGEWSPTLLESDAASLEDAVRGCLRPLGHRMSKTIACSRGLDVMLDEYSLSKEYKIPRVWKFAAHWFGAARFQNQVTAPQDNWDNTELSFKKKALKKTKRWAGDACMEEEEAQPDPTSSVFLKRPVKGMQTPRNMQTPRGMTTPRSPANPTMAFDDTPTNSPRLEGKEGKEGAGSMLEKLPSALDQDIEGGFNINDMDDLLAAEDEVVVADEGVMWPIFTVVQMIVAIGFWVVEASKNPLQQDDGFGWFYTQAGLENVVPGQTTVLVYKDCVRLSWQAWRWFSYQYTHVGASHISMNAFILLLAGWPLEGFQGHVRVFLLFNLGVGTGALVSMVWNIRSELVGMSAGCYCLLFVHIAELIQNWKESRFRWAKLILLLVIVGIDIANIQLTQITVLEKLNVGLEAVSHSAHIGGAISGLLLGIVFTRNFVVLRRERVYQAIALLLWCGFLAYHIAYLFEWPPKTAIDSEPWCWVRDVFNQTFFGDRLYHCVRCQNQECIDYWNGNNRWVKEVNWEECRFNDTFSSLSVYGTPPPQENLKTWLEHLGGERDFDIDG